MHSLRPLPRRLSRVSQPSALADLARKGRYAEMEEMHLRDCMLCGSCSYVCPSKIPLAQLFQASKVALRKAKAVPA